MRFELDVVAHPTFGFWGLIKSIEFDEMVPVTPLLPSGFRISTLITVGITKYFVNFFKHPVAAYRRHWQFLTRTDTECRSNVDCMHVETMFIYFWQEFPLRPLLLTRQGFSSSIDDNFWLLLDAYWVFSLSHVTLLLSVQLESVKYLPFGCWRIILEVILFIPLRYQLVCMEGKGNGKFIDVAQLVTQAVPELRSWRWVVGFRVDSLSVRQTAIHINIMPFIELNWQPYAYYNSN